MLKYLIAAMMLFATPVYAAATDTEAKPVCKVTVKDALTTNVNALKEKNKQLLNVKAFDNDAAHDLMHKIRDIAHFAGIPEDSEYAR